MHIRNILHVIFETRKLNIIGKFLKISFFLIYSFEKHT